MNRLFLRLLRPEFPLSWKTVLLEAGVIGLAGLAFGWIANALSPVGLELSRNYFPPIPEATATIEAELDPTTREPPGLSTVQAVGEQGDQAQSRRIGFEQAVALLESSAAQDGRLIFVDARSDAPYRAGHLPGAYLLDRFYPERFLPELLPAAMAAEQVIVYCTGGDCEDSEYAARMLGEAGVPVERLQVYRGGVEEWRARGGVMERGERLSGMLEAGGR